MDSDSVEAELRLSESELDALVYQFAELAVEGMRLGVILNPDVESINVHGDFSLWSRLATITRWLVNTKTEDPRTWTKHRGNTSYLPSLVAKTYEMDLFSQAIKTRALAEWQWGEPDPTDFAYATFETLGDAEQDELRVSFARRIDDFLAPYEERIARNGRIRRAAEDALQHRRKEAREAVLRSRPALAPQPQPYGVSPRGAELLVADWMRHIGIIDAAATPERSDGGIDVTSASHVAQVKHYKGNVGVPELRELYGVAASLGKRALFFTSKGYTAEAIAFAAATQMPLFTYSAELGTLSGANTIASGMV